MDFTYEAYSKLIWLIRENNYEIVDYNNCREHESCIILRHDIDYSIEKALQLAIREYDLGVKSTYFALLSSPFYNLASKNVISALKLINQYGHNIGLHFDEKNYSESHYANCGGIKKIVLKEVEMMEKLLDMPIKSVSMHRPSKRTLEADYDFGDIKNSYCKELFKNYKYISDSRKRWRENVEEIIESRKFKKLHILTHAFWYGDENETIEDTLMRFISNAGIERYNILNDNITDLQSIIKKSQIQNW